MHTQLDADEHDVHAALSEIDAALTVEIKEVQDAHSIPFDEAKEDLEASDINPEHPTAPTGNKLSDPGQDILKITDEEENHVVYVYDSLAQFDAVLSEADIELDQDMRDTVIPCHDDQADRIVGYEVTQFDYAVVTRC